jgi:hypothetical protein
MVRAAAEHPPLRAEADAALAGVVRVVGRRLNQREICWLVYHGLNARDYPSDGKTQPDPEWSNDPAVGPAAVHLLVLVGALGKTLAKAGVPLRSKVRPQKSVSVPLVLAQLLTLPIPWDSPHLVREHLNVGAVVWVDEDGGGTKFDDHATDRDKRAALALAAELAGPPTLHAYPAVRKSKWGEPIAHVVAQDPDVTARGVQDALDELTARGVIKGASPGDAPDMKTVYRRLKKPAPRHH